MSVTWPTSSFEGRATLSTWAAWKAAASGAWSAFTRLTVERSPFHARVTEPVTVVTFLSDCCASRRRLVILVDVCTRNDMRRTFRSNLPIVPAAF